MMNSNQLPCRDYECIEIDVDANSTGLDVENRKSMESFEDDSPSSALDDVPFGDCNSPSFSNRRIMRCFSPLIVLIIVAFSPLLLIAMDQNRSTKSASIPLSNTSSAVPQRSTSPFFESVLEWKKVPISEIPRSDFPFNTNRTNNTSSSEKVSGDLLTSNHYRGSIEFCSDPSKNLYGYGLVGNCVPGGSAPLIRMQPKRFYQLTLYNNAHIETNIHTHGLHVSGVGTVDDVTRVAKPGECLVYDHYILDDADVGTFWYHPHHHPNAESAYGGAYGMLIIDESDTITQQYYPEHLVNFLIKNEVLLQFSSMYNEKLSNPIRTNKVNGQDNLELFLSSDAYYYFRLSSVTYDDTVNYVEFDPPDACWVRVVAYDGVYRSKIPGQQSFQKHMMTVGSRSDLAVACNKHVEIHFHQGNLTNHSKLVTIHVEESRLLSTVVNNPVSLSIPAILPSSPYWDPEMELTWKPRRPYYMPDLAAPGSFVDEYWSVSLDDYFVNGTHGHLINQHKWDPNRSIRTFSLGQLVEYPILNSHKHPYHAHINRMQIVEPGGCGNRFEEGEYFDTIAQTEETSGGCKVRTKFFDFAGRVVVHCHRFEHEDHGMMAWVDIVGGDGHGTKGGAPAGTSTSCEALL